MTGTAGIDGNLASWNADGDVVDSGESAASILSDSKDYVDDGGGFDPSAYAGEQSVTLPNGMIMKFGQKTTGLPASGVMGTVTYDTPFPNSTIYANYIGNSYTQVGEANNVITAPLASSFSFVHGYVTINILFWFAIGY